VGVWLGIKANRSRGPDTHLSLTNAAKDAETFAQECAGAAGFSLKNRGHRAFRKLI